MVAGLLAGCVAGGLLLLAGKLFITGLLLCVGFGLLTGGRLSGFTERFLTGSVGEGRGKAGLLLSAGGLAAGFAGLFAGALGLLLKAGLLPGFAFGLALPLSAGIFGCTWLLTAGRLLRFRLCIS
jgi:hypothetical protein